MTAHGWQGKVIRAKIQSIIKKDRHCIESQYLCLDQTHDTSLGFIATRYPMYSINFSGHEKRARMT